MHVAAGDIAHEASKAWVRPPWRRAASAAVGVIFLAETLVVLQHDLPLSVAMAWGGGCC